NAARHHGIDLSFRAKSASKKLGARLQFRVKCFGMRPVDAFSRFAGCGAEICGSSVLTRLIFAAVLERLCSPRKKACSSFQGSHPRKLCPHRRLPQRPAASLTYGFWTVGVT